MFRWLPLAPVVVASGCAISATCSADADCPDGATCTAAVCIAAPYAIEAVDGDGGVNSVDARSQLILTE